MSFSKLTSLALEKCVMKAHLHFVISEAVVSGEVTTRDWSTIGVPDLLALNAAAATAADGAAEGGTPNAVRFAPVGGTVDTASGVVREAAPGGAAGVSAQTTAAETAVAAVAEVLHPRPPEPDNWANLFSGQRQNSKQRAGKIRLVDCGDAGSCSGDSDGEEVPRSPEFPARAVIRGSFTWPFVPVLVFSCGRSRE